MEEKDLEIGILKAALKELSEENISLRLDRQRLLLALNAALAEDEDDEEGREV